MPKSVIHHSGAYRYIPGSGSYCSRGVAAESGHAIEALQFVRPVPLAQAMGVLDDEIARRRLPTHALVGLQLRAPAAVAPGEFSDFNDAYLSLLDERHLLVRGYSPLSRTNVVPVRRPPSEATVHCAFLVVPVKGEGGRDFVVAGSGEAFGGVGPEHIRAFGDVSEEGLRAKRDAVLDEMRVRIESLGYEAGEAAAVNVYTTHEIPELGTALAEKLPSTATLGYVMHVTQPPVENVEFEMDCTHVSRTILVKDV